MFTRKYSIKIFPKIGGYIILISQNILVYEKKHGEQKSYDQKKLEELFVLSGRVVDFWIRVKLLSN